MTARPTPVRAHRLLFNPFNSPARSLRAAPTPPRHAGRVVPGPVASTSAMSSCEERPFITVEMIRGTSSITTATDRPAISLAVY